MPNNKSQLNHVLLTWDSFNNGFQVAVRAIELLRIEYQIQITSIIYLQDRDLSDQNQAELQTFRNTDQWQVQEKKIEKGNEEQVQRLAYVAETAGEWEEKGTKPNLVQKRIHLNSVTNYQNIYDSLVTFLKDWESEQKADFQLHINVSPGTPQMHVVWLMLNASGYLPSNTRLWSTQFDKRKGKHTIESIKFKPRTYLSEILQQNTRSGKGPDINPNDTISEARRKAEKDLEIFAAIKSAPLLVLGERGVGKSTLIRKHVHERLLPNIPFHELACGTFREELFRSELFGYKKGAFTGATEDKPGILSQFQNDGILFLDEIHDLSKPLQRELVQVLQTGNYYPIGSTKPERTYFRLISASNRSLSDLSDGSILDLDFFDRIVHLHIEIPPLRECREDLPRYWKFVWKEVAGNGESELWNHALNRYLISEPFHSNFRDLQRLAANIYAHYLGARKKGPNSAIQLGIQSFSDFQSKKTNKLSENSHYFIPETTFKEMEKAFRKDLIVQAEKYYGSLEKASQVLGRAVSTLYQDKR